MEGAKNDGVKGFVKGIGTGFMSGMVKGVTGIKETRSSAAKKTQNAGVFFWNFWLASWVKKQVKEMVVIDEPN